ncbi:hypothetical protein NPIL_67401 [Nephila pilipes]|uniref:Uncharacterized protein n=1 Tax=Nephila pilipes TaxID=299642 RepID=A0A8X6NSC2_NEPPI|nr:hypothetical protein NPIL_67401 [Nephila pilipes]
MSTAWPKSFTNLPSTQNRKPSKFERAEALRERRASHALKVLQVLPQREIESCRRSLPQREIESRRCLRWPQLSENHDHRRPERFYEGCRPRNPSFRRYRLSFAIDLLPLRQWPFFLAEQFSLYTLTVASEVVLVCQSTKPLLGWINGNPSPTDDPILQHRGSSDYPSSHLQQHALSYTTHRSVTLACTAGTGFIAVLLSLNAEKSAIARVFIKVYYVNALLFMLRMRSPPYIGRNKVIRSVALRRECPCLNSPFACPYVKPWIVRNWTKFQSFWNLEIFACGTPDLGHGIFSAFQ